MRPRLTIALLAGLLALLPTLGACQREAEPPPAPFAMTDEAMGRYCGMNIIEHSGPKGQIILAKYNEPIWFSSARDAIAFTMLPEEPKDIRAIYVSDMAKAPTWDQPGADNWVDARQAFFVIGSNRKGGMGAAEAVIGKNLVRVGREIAIGEEQQFDQREVDAVLVGYRRPDRFFVRDAAVRHDVPGMAPIKSVLLT